MQQKCFGCLRMPPSFFSVMNIFAMLINQESQKVHKFKGLLLKKNMLNTKRMSCLGLPMGSGPCTRKEDGAISWS